MNRVAKVQSLDSRSDQQLTSPVVKLRRILYLPTGVMSEAELEMQIHLATGILIESNR